MTQLYLYSNRLTGTIPMSLGGLTALNVLQLYSNRLTGAIPSSLGNLVALTELDLYSNGLTGTIPSSLGNLTALTLLRIGFNNISGAIPPSLGNISALAALGLESNQLTGTIPSSLGNLTALLTLDMYTNNLSGTIPPSLGNLTALIQLGLSNNQLVGTIPSSLGNLTALTYLSLASNQLTGTIPQSIGNLKALTYLGLYSNGLTGTIPSSLGNLTALTKMDMYTNQLSDAIPSSLSNLTALTQLGLSNNQLTGTIPSWLGNLTALTYLNLVSNQLTGAIPPSLGNLAALTELYLGTNNLTGVIPETLSNLSALELLGLGGNQLTGPVPRWLGSLTSLTHLGLSANRLTGVIPPSLYNLTELSSLNLGLNRLVGTIPSWLGTLTALTGMNLASNQLTGTIPSSLGNLTRLTELYISRNQLTGTIPRSLGRLTELKNLDIYSNQLTGTIPATLGFLTALTQLGLYSNGLTGTIPASLGNLTAMTELYLQSNQLTGTIPSSFITLTSLNSLFLASNQLTGAIPTWLGSLTVLAQIDLVDNQLTGAIPSSLSNLTALTYLGLSNNLLTGTIPTSIGNLPTLRYLGLSDNELIGAIPTSLGSISTLGNLTVGNNPGLTGSFPQWICGLTRLQALILERTAITGSLPSACLHRLSLLQDLDLRGLQLSGTLPSSLFVLPQLRYLLASGADFSSGLPQFECTPSNASALTGLPSDTPCITSGPTSAAQSGVAVTVGPQLRMVALVACGLSGEIPGWVGRLPRIAAIDLSGNDLSGPIPTFGAGTPLEQFSAANNRLSGTLDALRNATRLTRLSLNSNEVGGVVGDWLGNRSKQMSVMSTEQNYLSCALPTSTRISSAEGAPPGEAESTLHVLRGNLFSCPVPDGAAENDSDSDTYVCGSSDLTFGGAFFGVAAAVAIAVSGCLSVTRDRSRPKRQLPSPTHSDPAARASTATTGTPGQLLTWLLVLSAVLLAALVLPLYSMAQSRLECRYGWSTTAAFLRPGAWGTEVMVVGGLAAGGLVVCVLVAVGSRRGVVKVHGAQWSVGGWQIVRSVLIYAAVLSVLVLLNAAFVLLEESPHALGVAKHVIVVVFAALHEIVDHAVTPLIVSVMAVTVVGRPGVGSSMEVRVQGAQVLVASVMVELANSVVAPVIAQLGVSEGCFRDLIFSSPEAITTSVSVPYCSGESGWTNQTSCEYYGFVWTEYEISVTYTPPFRFDSGRCISSIVTLYTPEYLVIFALRVLVYPLAWWLARRGTPWIVTGIQPPVWLREAFVKTRHRVVSVMRCRTRSGGLADWRGIVSPQESTWTMMADGTAPPKNEGSRAKTSLLPGDGILESIHATEPTTHAFNLLAIAMCPGMFSPVIAVAAVGTVTCMHVWHWALDQRWPGGRGHDGVHSAEHATHPLPAVCVAMLLLLHSVYLVVLLSTADTAWGLWTSVGVNWVAFGVTCWLCGRGTVTGAGHDGGQGDDDIVKLQRPKGKASTAGGSGFELTERLLPDGANTYE